MELEWRDGALVVVAGLSVLAYSTAKDAQKRSRKANKILKSNGIKNASTKK